MPMDANASAIEVPLDPAQNRHLLTIDGLEPASRYEVTVALEPTRATLDSLNLVPSLGAGQLPDGFRGWDAALWRPQRCQLRR